MPTKFTITNYGLAARSCWWSWWMRVRAHA